MMGFLYKSMGLGMESYLISLFYLKLRKMEILIKIVIFKFIFVKLKM